MNALEAGLRAKCPIRAESDIESVLLFEVLASVVNFSNPSPVLGGVITRIERLFLAAVRQGVYQGSPTLSTRHIDTRDGAVGEPIVLTEAGRLARQICLRLRGSAQ
jgi:hypothetical protein